MESSVSPLHFIAMWLLLLLAITLATCNVYKTPLLMSDDDLYENNDAPHPEQKRDLHHRRRKGWHSNMYDYNYILRSNSSNGTNPDDGGGDEPGGKQSPPETTPEPCEKPSSSSKDGWKYFQIFNPAYNPLNFLKGILGRR